MVFGRSGKCDRRIVTLKVGKSEGSVDWENKKDDEGQRKFFDEGKMLEDQGWEDKGKKSAIILLHMTTRATRISSSWVANP